MNKTSRQQRNVRKTDADRKLELEAVKRMKAASELENRAASIGRTIATMEHERLSLLAQAAVLRMTWEDV